ncbi:MAG TPA: glutathione synthase [Leucothrix mucor]|nr:glutathione synthase [Leucothrix mucor]
MKKSLQLGIIMDPIESINTKKDSTFAMMLEAQKRGWRLFYMQQHDLFVEDGIVSAQMKQITLKDDPQDWFEVIGETTQALHHLDCSLMRKDPPFDMEYIYSTYLLELAEKQGTLIVNRPASIRSANEKLFTALFPDCSPETLVSRDMERIKLFQKKHKNIVVKPLDGMGGSMIFQIREGDTNRNVILEAITNNGKQTVMAQRFLPEYTEGDKRILLIDGEPFPYALARLPAKGEGRANLAAGGTYKGVALSKRDLEICKQVAPTLKEMGLMFVGLDVIGDYLTEINVTSPTCIRELDTIYSANIAGLLMDSIEEKLTLRGKK